MADDDDAETAADDAYDLSSVRRERHEEVITMPASSAAGSSEPAPDWAQKWKTEQKRPPRLKGTCAKWNAKKGFGFVAREDELPDIYVHQRDVQKTGFRSLKEGEQVEFDVAAMEDGRLHGVRVSGPGGVDVQGLPPKDDSDEEEEAADDTRGAGGKAAAAKPASASGSKPYAKPAFLPRAVARPKPAAKPKPKPAAPATPVD